MKYPTPLLNALGDGAVVDQRFKLATALATNTDVITRMFGEHCAGGLPAVAKGLLDLAEAIYDAGDTRGWITPLPTSNDLPPTEKAHVERSGKAQVTSNLAAQRFAQEEQSRIHTPPPGVIATSARIEAGRIVKNAASTFTAWRNE